MDTPERSTPAELPWLFAGQGLLVLAGVAVVGALSSSFEVALLASALLLVGLLARAWAAVALARIRYGRRLIPPRAFCGDSLVLETSLSNGKLLPLPWLEAWELIPRALGLEGETEPSYTHPQAAWLCQGAALWPYQRARWRHTLACHRRGVFALAHGRIRSGDPFGVIERMAEVPQRLEVVVYPRVVPLRRLSLPIRHPAVDATGARSLVADPTRTAALRDYRPGDSLRLIHWPTTARRGALQVRVLEPATSLRISLAVDVHAFASHASTYREALFELSLSAVASIAAYLHERGHPVGLYASASPAVGLPPGSGPGQLEALLEALARLEPMPSQPLLPWALEGVPRGSTLVLATSDLAPDLGASIARLEQGGRHVSLLLASREDRAPGGELPSDRVVRISPGCDLAAMLEGQA